MSRALIVPVTSLSVTGDGKLWSVDCAHTPAMNSRTELISNIALVNDKLWRLISRDLMRQTGAMISETYCRKAKGRMRAPGLSSLVIRLVYSPAFAAEGGPPRTSRAFFN